MGEIEYETPIEIKDIFKAFRNILNRHMKRRYKRYYVTYFMELRNSILRKNSLY